MVVIPTLPTAAYLVAIAMVVVIPAYAIAIRNKQAVMAAFHFGPFRHFYGTGGMASKVPIGTHRAHSPL